MKGREEYSGASNDDDESGWLLYSTLSRAEEEKTVAATCSSPIQS
jgi:hypothetical protein